MFSIDPTKYRIIDLSYEVLPGENAERPFAIQKSRLADQTFRYDILQTHTHVGTHVEVPSHFFHEGRALHEFPLDYFFGRAVLLSVREEGDFPSITGDYLEAQIGDIMQPGDIVIARNDSSVVLTKDDLYRDGFRGAPHFTPSAATWLRDHQVKLVGLDFIRLGEDIPNGREFHDILMREDVSFIEMLANLQAITRREFFFMGLPFKVRGLDSGWIRAIAIEEI